MNNDLKTTIKHTCGDTVQDLDDVTGFVFQYELANGKLTRNVSSCFITCEDADIRFAYGINPTQAGLGHILSVGQSLILEGAKVVKNLRFINHTNGVDAVLQISPEVSSS